MPPLRLASLFSSFFLLGGSLSAVVAADPSRNPYKVLGVPRAAGMDAIRKAYKSLAVKYHPDKNREEGAVARFQEIQNAYEVLSDPQKKRSYDAYGSSEPRRSQRGHRVHQYYMENEWSDSISIKLTNDNWDLLTKHSKGFQFDQGGELWGPEHGDGGTEWGPSLTLDGMSVMLVYVFGSYCRLCSTVAPIWEQAADTLKDVMLTAKVHGDYESGVVDRLGVRQVPAIVAVRWESTVDGTIYKSVFRGSIDKRAILEFAATQLQTQAKMELLTHNVGLMTFERRLKEFHKSDKVRVLVLSNSRSQRFNHLFAANLFRHHAIFGHVCLRCMGKDQEKAIARIIGAPLTENALKAKKSKDIVLVYRDEDVAEQFNDVPSQKNALVTFLSNLAIPRVPEVTRDNFYELCFGGRGSGRLAQVRAAKGAPKSSRLLCLIALSNNKAEAASKLLPWFSQETCLLDDQLLAGSSSSVLSPSQRQCSPAVPRAESPLVAEREGVQLGWIRRGAHGELERFLKQHAGGKANPSIVLLDANFDSFSIYSEPSAATADNWIAGVLRGTLPLQSDRRRSIPWPAVVTKANRHPLVEAVSRMWAKSNLPIVSSALAAIMIGGMVMALMAKPG